MSCPPIDPLAEGMRPPSLFDVKVNVHETQLSGEIGHYDEEPEMEYVIKMRGCPWAMTVEDVVDFFGAECQIMGDRDGIHLVKTSEGRATGECFVEMLTDRDVELALNKDHQNMGHRYIEVYKVKKIEMDWILKRCRPDENMNGSGFRNRSRPPATHGSRMLMDDSGSDHGYTPFEHETFVRLRGLPFECTTDDIEQFFAGLAIAPNGIQVGMDSFGKVTGEAYVQFQSHEMAEMALQRDRECIGHRYVEVFRVSHTELRNQMKDTAPRNQRNHGPRPTPYDRPQPRERPGMGRQHAQMGHQRPMAGGNRNFGRGGGGGHMGNGGGSGGARGRGGSGFSRGGGQNTWNDYANRVENSWGLTGSGSGGNSSKPAPRPLLPGLKGSQRMTSSDEFSVLMRGLPWSATEGDINNFFAPIPVRGVEIIFDETNRPSGSARAFFDNSQFQDEALHRHRQMMGKRYVELFVE